MRTLRAVLKRNQTLQNRKFEVIGGDENYMAYRKGSQWVHVFKNHWEAFDIALGETNYQIGQGRTEDELINLIG